MNNERGTTAPRKRSSFIVPRSSFFLIAAVLFAQTVFALDIPPAPAQWFTDAGGIVDAAQSSALNDKLAQFEQRSGAQLIIYTFPSLDGEALEDFTIRCAERWKVGNKKYDNGLILFVFVKEKKVRVEVGYGLEGTMTDAVSSRVIREQIAPNFQQGNYGAGLHAAADAIIARIEKNEAPVAPVNGGRGAQSAKPNGFDGFAFIILLFVFFVFILPMLRRRGGGGGGCGGCFWPMFFLGGGGGGTTFGGGGWDGGGGGGGFGGFSGGGGSFGGGGASGGW